MTPRFTPAIATDNGPGIFSSEERQEQIVEATVSCIAAQGYDSVTLRDVSKKAGVSIGLIQHHFESREQLMVYAIRHASRRLARRFHEVGAGISDPWQRIEALIEQLCTVDNLKKHTDLWLEFAGAAGKHARLASHLQAVYESWSRYVYRSLQDGIAEGTLAPELSVDDTVSVFMAYFDGYEFDIATGLAAPDREALRRRTMGLARLLFRPTLNVNTAHSEPIQGDES